MPSIRKNRTEAYMSIARDKDTKDLIKYFGDLVLDLRKLRVNAKYFVDMAEIDADIHYFKEKLDHIIGNKPEK
tara:strand:- start:202 stop:420 length:219 start_codon:yes stop_codon:yes gene_type:complete